MRPAVVILAVALCISPSATTESAPEQERILSSFSGEAWRSWTQVMKLCYLGGYLDADESYRVVLADASKGSDEVRVLLEMMEQRHPPLRRKQIAQIIEGTDRFYEDYRNKHLHIVFALKIVAMELAGRDAAEIDTETRRLRQLFQE